MCYFESKISSTSTFGKKRYLFAFFLILYLVNFSSFCFAQQTESIEAQEKQISVPNTIEEAIAFLVKFFGMIPEALKNVSREALNFWQRIYQKLVEIWGKYFSGKFQKLLTFLKEQFFFRRSIFKEEFLRKVQESKKELSNYFNRIFKKNK